MNQIGRVKETATIISQYFPTVPLIEEERFMEIGHGQHDTMSPKARTDFCREYYKKMEASSSLDQTDRFAKWKKNHLADRAIPFEREKDPLVRKKTSFSSIL